MEQVKDWELNQLEAVRYALMAHLRGESISPHVSYR